MTVQIIVQEYATKRPLKGILVEVYNNEITKQTYTDNDGNAFIDILHDDKFIIKIRSPEHRPYTRKHFISRKSIISTELAKAYI